MCLTVKGMKLNGERPKAFPQNIKMRAGEGQNKMSLWKFGNLALK